MKRSTLLGTLSLLLLVLASCSRDPKVQAQRDVANGNKFFAKAKYKEAAIMYKKALSRDQRFGEAYYRLALADMQLGSLSEAVGMLRRAVDLQPDNTDAAVQLANIYLIASTQDEKNSPQLLEEASGLAEKLLAKDPKSYDGHRLSGQIALVKKDPKTAIEELQIANQLKPNQAEVVMAYFEALIRDKQEPAAEKLARDFISQEKTLSAIYDRLYLQYMTEKRLDDAEKILKLKIENNPKSSNYLLQLAAHYVIVNRRPDMEAVMSKLTDEKQFPDGHLLAGDFYFFRTRDFELAKQQYLAGSAAFPKDKLTYQKRLVELYANTGGNTQANQLVETLLKENPKDADVIAMHAALMLTSGKPDEINQAVADLQGLVAKSPTNHLLRFSYARALLAQGQETKNGKNGLEQARLQLEDAIKTRPDFLAARELLARVYLAKPDAAKALQVSEDLLQLDKNNLTGHLTRSAALLALGTMDKAREELDLITRLFPQNPDARYQVGLLAWQDKDYKKAEQVFQALYRDNPKDNRGLFGITETLASQNRLDEAIKVLKQAADAQPDRMDLKLGLANFDVRAQRYDDAIAIYKGALEKQPNTADLLYRLAETYRRKGDINLAAEMFRKSSQAAPNSTLPLLSLGLILETIGPVDQAKAVYEQILKLDPNHAVALNNLAFRKAEEGLDLDSALSMAQRAHQIQPNATAMADTLGWIYIKKNLSTQAEGIFKDLVAKEPANATFHYHYGMALMQKGDKTSARRELEIALKNKPPKDEAGKIQDLLTKL
ncbi:MAG TPA: tetratricopeptide repeat protein [Bryobacteraceae bacterium]|nr:tetratricopeptide repeat protein [Bryobacteraceae bacterium]